MPPPVDQNKNIAPQIGGDIPVIDDPTLLQIANRVTQSVKLAAAKAIAHEGDPQLFPLPAENDSLERIIHRYAVQQDPVRRKESAARATQILKSLPPEFHGDLDRINVRSAEPIEQQFMRLEAPDSLKLAAARITNLTFANNHVGAQLLPENMFFIKGGHLVRKDLVSPNPIPSLIIGPPMSITKKWTSLGGAAGFLGDPITEEAKTPDGKGAFRHFKGGSIYWTPATGAHEVHGSIYAKWASLDWERSFLGYPTTDETKTPDGVGRYSHFQGGSIYWTPTTGAWAVHKNVRDAWEKDGWELGSLGYPLSDTQGVGSATMLNLFQGGRVDWNNASGAKIVRTMTKLQFRLHSVKCVEETNEAGSDELDFCGASTDAVLRSNLITRFRVSNDFDSGEVVTYSPPRVVHTFDLLDPVANWWPKTYSITMVLAEIDSGGFHDTLVGILGKIRDLVQKELTKLGISLVAGGLAGLKLGALVGALIPGLGTIVAGVVGAVVGFIVGGLFDALLGIFGFGDDLFKPLNLPISIASVHQRWGGAADTPEWFCWLKGHGGHYEVRGDWALVP